MRGEIDYGRIFCCKYHMGISWCGTCFFMQAGFAMVETGFTRAKNAGNIIMKNLMDFCIGTPLYWLVGFGIMFGTSSAFFGNIDLFAVGGYSGAYDSILPDGVPLYAYMISRQFSVQHQQQSFLVLWQKELSSVLIAYIQQSSA